jgi:hypothetical protein
MAARDFRTTITTGAGLVALLGIGALAAFGDLDPSAVSVLSLAIVGVCGGQAARSGVEAVAKARNGGGAVQVASAVVEQIKAANAAARKERP